MPRIEFEADTEEQLLALARRWVMGPEHHASVTDAADQADLRQRQMGEVLNAIRGPDSRRLLREVAELSTQDAALVLDAELAARYGKSTGTAFAGIVAGPATSSPVTTLLAPRVPTPCWTLATWRGYQVLRKSERMPPWRQSSR